MSTFFNTPTEQARKRALTDAYVAVTSYLLDYCPDDQRWEDFDPDADSVRTELQCLIEAPREENIHVLRTQSDPVS